MCGIKVSIWLNRSQVREPESMRDARVAPQIRCRDCDRRPASHDEVIPDEMITALDERPPRPRGRGVTSSHDLIQLGIGQ